MKTFLNILFLVLILCSCKGKESHKDLYSLKEDSLIYQLVDTMVMPDSIWRKHLLIPPPFFLNGDSKTINKQRDSLLQRWDTAQLYLAFDDSLILFSRSHNSEKIKDTKSYFKYNLSKLDTSYFALFDKIVTDTTLKKRRIEIKGFKTKYNYRIISSDSISMIRNMGFRVIEIYTFSRVVFNNKFDRACLYGQGVCGGECGGGYLIFLEKKNDVWEIIERYELWVS